MFMIVETCNFGGDYPDEKEVCLQSSEDNGYHPLVFSSEDKAKQLCETLNKALSGELAPRIYVVKPHGYKLQEGFEP